MISFARQTIIRVRAPEVVDRYGNTRRDWANATRTPIGGCVVQPMSADELVAAGRDAVTVLFRLHAPADTDLVATDRVGWLGIDYDVDGAPRNVSSPTGSLDHLEAFFTTVEG